MNAIFYILSGLVFFVAWYFVTKNIQFKRFRRTMRPGVQCWYYSGEDRIRCVIHYIVNGRVVIVNEYGEIIETTKENLYV